jgi:hypothetical protein
MMELMPIFGLGVGGLLMGYGALVTAAIRLGWKWFVQQPQVRRTLKTGGQPRATLTYTTIGLGLFSLGLLIFLASLAQLNSA